MTLADRYTYSIRWSEGDRQFVGTCDEFPSLSWLATQPIEALHGIRALVQDVLADMATNGEEPPCPSS